MGGFTLGQISALTPDYEKARVAAARLLKIFDRKPLIDSSSENGLTPVRILPKLIFGFEGFFFWGQRFKG